MPDVYNNDALLFAFAALLAVCALLFIQTFSKRSKIHGTQFYYRLACVNSIACLCLCLIAYQSQNPQVTNVLALICELLIAYIIGALCLHVYVQVLHRKPPVWMLVLCLYAQLATTFISILILTGVFVSASLTTFISVLEGLLIMFSVVRMFQLVFRVLYNTSRQMRSRVYLLLIGALFTFAIPILVSALLNTILPVQQLILLSSETIALVFFYLAQRLSPPEHVTAASHSFVMDNLSTIVLMLDDKMQVLDWNLKLRNSPFPLPVQKENFSEYRNRLLAQKNCITSPHNENIFVIMQNGTETQYLLSINAASSETRLIGYLVEISEVTPLYSIMNYFREAATLDHLTNFYNRNGYLRIVRELTRQENMPLLIMVGDINRLKVINDTYGHLQGDKLLLEAAKRIRAAVPENSIVARIGGDEFVILLPRGSDESFLQMTREMKRAYDAAGAEEASNPNISWGYAVMQDGGESFETAFARADEMMYENKARWYQLRDIERRQH